MRFNGLVKLWWRPTAKNGYKLAITPNPAGKWHYYDDLYLDDHLIFMFDDLTPYKRYLAAVELFEQHVIDTNEHADWIARQYDDT